MLLSILFVIQFSLRFFFVFSDCICIVLFCLLSFPFDGIKQRLKKRDIEQQASSPSPSLAAAVATATVSPATIPITAAVWIDDRRAKEVIDIDDNIPFKENNASTNDISYFRTMRLNSTTTQANGIEKPVGKFMFKSMSLKTETIVLLSMFGICTIIYSSKYYCIDVKCNQKE